MAQVPMAQVPVAQVIRAQTGIFNREHYIISYRPTKIKAFFPQNLKDPT